MKASMIGSTTEIEDIPTDEIQDQLSGVLPLIPTQVIMKIHLPTLTIKKEEEFIKDAIITKATAWIIKSPVFQVVHLKLGLTNMENRGIRLVLVPARIVEKGDTLSLNADLIIE